MNFISKLKSLLGQKEALSHSSAYLTKGAATVLLPTYPNSVAQSVTTLTVEGINTSPVDMLHSLGRSSLGAYSSLGLTRQDSFLRIKELLSKNEFSNAQLYDAFKWADIGIQELSLLTDFSSDTRIPAMIVSSFNCSGRTREAALHWMINDKNPKFLRYILFRLADWVKPISKLAEQGVIALKVNQNVSLFAQNIDVILWLKTVRRNDLNALVDELLALVADNSVEWSEQFPNWSDKTRLLIAKYMMSCRHIDMSVLPIFLGDPYVLVRQEVVKNANYIASLTDDECRLLLNERSSTIKLDVLRHLNTMGRFYHHDRLTYAIAESNNVRRFAQFTLKKDGYDLTFFYRSNLPKGQNILGSLLGLWDLGAGDAKTIQFFLSDESAKVRTAAFLAMSKINKEKANRFALENMDCDSVTVRKQIFLFLYKNVTDEALRVARNNFQNADERQQIYLLRLFSAAGGLSILTDLMQASVSESATTRRIAVSLMRKWRAEQVNNFVTVSDDLQNHVNEVWKHCYAEHEAKKYFPSNPMHGLNQFFNLQQP